ncbi:uncharacterized protein LOC122456561 isoform X2 [Dermochelys coriacea]|uniref:uncharacterized protein LOC122456561 isoform X2 n=1 Tax=Dermochelys coriacea TaxID=27794 RepID=UPI001CA9192F|nr:uncharacterized protein LOC122456561 isoform X2 [Dermochelys coriacea]
MGLSKDLGVISRPPRSLIVLGVSRLVDSPQTPLLLTCAPEGSALPGASAAPGTLSKDLWPLGVSSSPRASPLLLGLSPRTSGPRVSLLAPRVSAAPRTLSKDLQPLGVSYSPRGQNSSAQGMSSEDLHRQGIPATLRGCSKDLQPLGFSTPLGTCSKDLLPLGFSSTPGGLHCSRDLLQGSPAPGVLLHPRGLRCSQDLLQGPPAPGARSLGTLHPAPRRRAAPTFALSPPGRQPALGFSATTTLSLAAPPRPSKPGRVHCDWTGRCLDTLGTAVRLADEGRPRCEMVPGASGSTFISSCLFGFLMFFKDKGGFWLNSLCGVFWGRGPASKVLMDLWGSRVPSSLFGV